MTASHDPFAVLRGDIAVPAPTTREVTWEPWAAIMGTGLFTLSSVAVSAVAALFELGAIPASEVLVSVGLYAWVLSAIAGYVGLCLWMQAVRTRLAEAGYDAPASWKIWAGWVIPFYALVAPFLVMRGLRTRVLWQGNALTAVWWLAFLGSSFVDRAYAVYPAFDTVSLSLLAVSAVLIVTSYAALVATIRSTSASLAPRAA